MTARARGRRPRLRFALLALAALAAGCSEGGAVLPASEEPFFYLVLNQRAGTGASRGQYALLLTTGSVRETFYLAADRFEMRRSADGARFAWRSTGRSGQAPGDHVGIALLDGNYFLPDSAADGLGARDLRPGAAYELRVEAGGVAIDGSVVVPERFDLRLDPSGARRVVWPEVAGAAGYSVEIRGWTAPELQRSTSIGVPADVAGRFTVTVRALDPQAYAYQSEPQRARSGISTGYGVFGAVSVAEAEFELEDRQRGGRIQIDFARFTS